VAASGASSAVAELRRGMGAREQSLRPANNGSGAGGRGGPAVVAATAAAAGGRESDDGQARAALAAAEEGVAQALGQVTAVLLQQLVQVRVHLDVCACVCVQCM